VQCNIICINLIFSVGASSMNAGNSGGGGGYGQNPGRRY